MRIKFSDGYQVNPLPRWGHGLALHPQILSALEKSRADYARVLEELETHRAALHAVSHDYNPRDPTAPFWNNVWFSTLDAASLVGFLLSRKPTRYLEIGSGHSTMFARYAVRSGGLRTAITSVDPRPRAQIDALCDRVVRAPLETCDLAVFEELEPNDLLFLDGSHRIFTNSDVTVFFLEVLPRLKPGVLVHVHDVFLPADYPPAWNTRGYSEQYLLGAMLLCGAPPIRVILPNYYVCTDSWLGSRVRDIFRAGHGGRDIPIAYANAGKTPGVSFWLETVRPLRAPDLMPEWGED